MRKLISGLLVCVACNACQAQTVQQLTATEFKAQLETAGPQSQLLDVRTPAEFSGGHLDHALNINYNDPAFKDKIAGLDKQRPVYVYCLGGGRSAAAAALLHDNGFTQVYDMKGGIMAWKNNGLAVSTAENKTVVADKFTRADWDRLLADNPVVLVDFYAEWCVPCKKMAPMLERLAAAYKGKALIYRLNIDEAKALTAELKVEGLPVFHLYKQGKLLRTLSGEQDEKSIRSVIAAAQ